MLQALSYPSAILVDVRTTEHVVHGRPTQLKVLLKLPRLKLIAPTLDLTQRSLTWSTSCIIISTARGRMLGLSGTSIAECRNSPREFWPFPKPAIMIAAGAAHRTRKVGGKACCASRSR